MGQSSNSDKISRGVHTTEPAAGQLNAILQQSSTEEDNSTSLASQIYESNEASDYKCNKIEDTMTSDAQDECTESGEIFKRDLYKMKGAIKKGQPSPSKIEFKLYKSSKLKKARRQERKHSHHSGKICNTRRKCTCIKSIGKIEEIPAVEEESFFSRLKNSFSKMRKPGIPSQKKPSTQNLNNDYTERMDIYYFDHGNSAYFRTTDCPPQLLSEIIANQTTHYATRFWAEIFGSLHIGMAFFVTFFMQAYRFLLYSIARPILVGILQMTSDYLVKPIITIIFNGLLQPPLILLYNVLSSIQDMLRPVAGTLDNFLKPVAGLFRAIRLVSFTNKKEVSKTTTEAV